MKASQYLRKIPLNPVVFNYYSKNDPIPTVMVTKLIHDELNPGFLGVNLNYIPVQDKAFVLETIKMLTMMKTLDNMSDEFKNMISTAIRRYNYCNIDSFIYRGNKQDHNRGA